MKLLQNKVNVSAPDAVYPFGSLKNDTGAGDGTPVDVEMLTDYVQLLEKMFDDSKLVSNNLPDNVTNGFQMYTAFKRMTREYKQYNATIRQTAANNPTATVLGLNEIGGVVWTRISAGVYKGTLAGAFPDNTKVQLNVNPGYPFENEIRMTVNAPNAVTLFTETSTIANDGVLLNTSIEIRVYP